MVLFCNPNRVALSRFRRRRHTVQPDQVTSDQVSGLCLPTPTPTPNRPTKGAAEPPHEPHKPRRAHRREQADPTPTNDPRTPQRKNTLSRISTPHHTPTPSEPLREDTRQGWGNHPEPMAESNPPPTPKSTQSERAATHNGGARFDLLIRCKLLFRSIL